MAVSKMSMAGVIIIPLIIVGIWAGLYYGGLTKGLPNVGGKKPYEAVFLTNGQVYFGKIKNVSKDTTMLEDIYYLQVQQPIQPADQKKDQQPQVQLVKLGGELHKPKDEMSIRNSQILFTEEIQDDGQVGQAIARHKSGADQQPAPQAQTQPQGAPSKQ